MAKITAAGIESLIEMLLERVEARYQAVTANNAWPSGMKGAGDKVMAIIKEEVTTLLSGDLSATANALIAEVAKLLKTGHGPISKSLADLA